MEDKGYIYVLTNKAFSGHDWVKIGFATDVEARRKQLSNTSVPYPYEVYATYEVSPKENLDKVLHRLIQTLNPQLRLTSNREFFIMKPEEAYEILRCMAVIHGTTDKLKGPEYWSKETESKEKDEKASPLKPLAYTESYHLDDASDQIAGLYQKLREKILSLGDIDIKPTKLYIAFKRGKRNVCDVEFYARKLRVFLNLEKGNIVDPERKTIDVSDVGHHGNGDYVMDIAGTSEIEYLMSLVRQSYERQKS